MNTMWRLVLPVVLLFSAYSSADENTFALPQISFDRVAHDEAGIRVDGALDEAVWANLPSFNNFRVVQPDTLDETEYETHVRFFYTEEGLYVGVVCDQPVDTLVARLSSRDQFISRDGVSITLDPGGSGLYAYWFGVNLGGTLSDGTVLPERQFRNQWDGPWNGASKELETGYSVEFFLPWSMMTMPEVADAGAEKRTMGFYISRSVAHRNERWTWPALPSTRNVFLSSLQAFDIDNIEPKRQFTFYPYASSAYNVIEEEDRYKTGFDIFWRPSSNLQLTATINPDFGNVESDDVDVNLTSFETFFPEKRPFFLEGQEIFNTTPRSRSRGRGTPTVIVNTRRIGSPPIEPDIPGFELPDLEENQPTELHGAAKVTGQNGAIRYGLLAAIEDDTKLAGSVNDVPLDVIAEGRDFAAARFLYEVSDGNSRRGIGWISTLVDHPTREAQVHGIDLHYLSGDGKWNTDGQLLYSDIDGITGAGGFVDINYAPARGKQHSLALDYFDDELEINDFGFLRRNDAISARYRYQVTESDIDWLQSRETSYFLSQEYNTDGLVVRSGIFFQQEYEFHNNTELETELSYFPSRWDDLNSEGNGSYKIDPRWQGGAYFSSDRAKPLQFGVGYFFQEEDIGGMHHEWVQETNWRPSDKFSLSLVLAYHDRSDWLIHYSGPDFTTFESEQWRPRLEVDYFFTARQQLRMTAQWIGIKSFERDRFRVPPGDGTLEPVAPAPGDTARDFSISRMVLQARYRWEIAPLSDLFVVYTRGSDLPSDVSLGFDDLLRDSWTDRAVDVFVVKLRYRMGS